MIKKDIYDILCKLENIENKANNIQNRIYELLERKYKPKKEEKGTMYRFLDHPQEAFFPGNRCYVPTFNISPMEDELFVYTWVGRVKAINDGGREAVIENVCDHAPKIVSVGLLGHTADEAKCRMIEWVERFVDDHRAYWRRGESEEK